MTTTIRVTNNNSWLISTDREFKSKLSAGLRARPKGYFHNVLYKKKKWDGWKYFFDEKSGRFMTGILPEVKNALAIDKKSYTIVDQRQHIRWLYETIGDDFLNDTLPEGFDPIKLHDFQPDFANKCFMYNRGIVQAPTGCHKKGQQILMFDGNLKFVEDIAVGEKLMGPDSRPRVVLRLCRGKQRMYRITPTKGSPFIVNEDHVLSLIRTPSNHNRYPCEKGGQIVDVTVKEWLQWSKWKKHIHKLFRPEKIQFKISPLLKLDPYFLGIMLGDGSFQNTPIITTESDVIAAIFKEYIESKFGLKFTPRLSETKCPAYAASGQKGRSNPLANELRKLKLWNLVCEQKFIPHCYKTANVATRLQLLAGIIDTDGSLDNNTYDINLKSERLAKDIAFIARSVGMAAYVKPNIKSSQNGTKGLYHRVSISGHTNQIPCKLKNKQASPRKQKKNVLRTGFSVKALGIDEYFGFKIDGDRRYLLDDFTITHNSGKTFVLISLLKSLPPKTPVLFLTNRAQLVEQNYEEMKLWGIQNVGRWYDKYHEPNWITCATVHKDTFNSLSKLLPNFAALLVDEVDNCVSDVPIRAYKKMQKAFIRIGFSATPFRYHKKKIDKVHKLLVKSNFGPIFKTDTTESGYLTTKYLQERGILSPSNCTFNVIDKPDLAYEPYQDAIKMGIAENFFFHDAVKRLAKSLSGRTLIVVERIAQGEYLKGLIPEAHWIQGSTKLKDRRPVIEALKEGPGNTIAIVMRPIITAGINIRIHNLINAAGGDAAHNLIQQIGRGLRPAGDKDTLQYYDWMFLINDYLRKHSAWRMEVLENEGHTVTLNYEMNF